MIESDINRAWTTQLYREYDHLLFRHRLKLDRPLIVIGDFKDRHGEWDSGVRTIRISRHTIREYPWDTVIEVLKHEVAHQFAHDILGATNGFHDSFFQQACDRLGVAHWARSASGNLPSSIPDWRQSVLTDDEERLLRRAEKLLSLSKSCNENEAALAMQRVRELYERYNLSQLAQRKTQTYLHTIIDRKKRRISRTESKVYSLLASFFFVEVIYGEMYDANLCREHKVVEILGTRENVLMAEYVVGFLQNQLDALWRAARKDKAYCGIRHRNSFEMGVLTGFEDKLRGFQASSQPSAEDLDGFGHNESIINRSEAFALERQRNIELNKFVSYRHPRLASRNVGRGSLDGAPFRAGVSAGRDIVFSRPLTAWGNSATYYLKG